MDIILTANGAPRTAIQIPCCLCGTLIYPNSVNQCGTCLASQYNLQPILQLGPTSSGGELYVHQCRKCRRYQHTESYWAHHEVESSELLTLCLQKIPALLSTKNKCKTKNINKTRSSSSSATANADSYISSIQLVDAMWIWTEPHSMRFKLRLTVQAEVGEAPRSVRVQQRVPIEFKVTFQMCPQCNRQYTNRTWHALVQVRQRFSLQQYHHRHSTPSTATALSAKEEDNEDLNDFNMDLNLNARKNSSSQRKISKSKTKKSNSSSSSSFHASSHHKGLYMLENFIRQREDLWKDILKVETSKNGYDFYFLDPIHAQTFTSAISQYFPMKIHQSSKVVSEDVKNNTKNMKYTFVCDLVPFNRDDLLFLLTRKHQDELSMGANITSILQSSSLSSTDKNPMADCLYLVLKMAGMIHLVHAAPRVHPYVQPQSQSHVQSSQSNLQLSQTRKRWEDQNFTSLSSERYWKMEKNVFRLLTSQSLTRFIVLNVELVNKDLQDLTRNPNKKNTTMDTNFSFSLDNEQKEKINVHAVNSEQEKEDDSDDTFCVEGQLEEEFAELEQEEINEHEVIDDLSTLNMVILPRRRRNAKMKEKYLFAQVEVARESDMGKNNDTFHCTTHLGHLLQAGDVVLGYDLITSVICSSDDHNRSSEEDLRTYRSSLPDVVLVRKVKGAHGQNINESESLSENNHRLDKDIDFYDEQYKNRRDEKNVIKDGKVKARNKRSKGDKYRKESNISNERDVSVESYEDEK